MKTTLHTNNDHHIFTAEGGNRSLFIDHARYASMCTQVKINATRTNEVGTASFELSLVCNYDGVFSLSFVRARGGGKWTRRITEKLGEDRATALVALRAKLATLLLWLEGTDIIQDRPLAAYL